jgi:hypothetical protein
MGAYTIIGERAATACPAAFMEEDGVSVVIATHGHGKILELDAIGFVSVQLGFGDFADQA